MKPLWGAKWFCPVECDLPPEKRTPVKPYVPKPLPSPDFMDEEDTRPLWRGMYWDDRGLFHVDSFPWEWHWNEV